MSKHSKRNTALPVFTYWERHNTVNEYGTQTRRLGKESVKDWDACSVCLNQISSEPMSCPKGHLFCKACIYENLLTQKEDKKQQQLLYERQQKQLEEDDLIKEEKKKEEIADKFLTQGNRITIDDQKKSSEHTEKGASSKKAVGINLNCFWIPSLTPSSEVKKIKPPSKYTMCPEGPHKLKLKELRPVKFTLSEKNSKSIESGRYICPVCLKTLKNVIRASHLSSCGHVLCTSCTERFVKVDEKCPVCNTRTPYSTNVISLQAGGTGFSGHGAELEAKKVTPAFQSF